MAPAAKERDRGQMGDLKLFILALLVAMSIWLIAKRTETDSDNIDVPVVLTGVPDYIELRPVPDSVNVSLQFPRALRGDLIPDNFEVRIEAELLGAAKFARMGEWGSLPHSLQSLELQTTNDDLPRDAFTVTRYVPGTIEIQGRYRGTTVSIEPNIVGETAEDFQFVPEKMLLIPREVFIAGPAELLSMLPMSNVTGAPYISTSEIEVTGAQTTFVRSVDLRLPRGLRVIQARPEVEVTVAIEPVLVQRTLEGVTVTLRLISSVEARVTPSTVSIDLEATKAQWARIDESAFIFLPGGEIEESAGRSYQDVPLEARLRRDLILPNPETPPKILRILPDRVDIRFVAPLEESASLGEVPEAADAL